MIVLTRHGNKNIRGFTENIRGFSPLSPPLAPPLAIIQSDSITRKNCCINIYKKVTIMLGSETFRQQTKLSYSTPPYQKTELLMTAINLVFTCHHSIKHNFKGGTQLLIIESDLMLFLQTFQCARGWSVFFKDRKVSQRKFQLP